MPMAAKARFDPGQRCRKTGRDRLGGAGPKETQTTRPKPGVGGLKPRAVSGELILSHQRQNNPHLIGRFPKLQNRRAGAKPAPYVTCAQGKKPCQVTPSPWWKDGPGSCSRCRNRFATRLP